MSSMKIIRAARLIRENLGTCSFAAFAAGILIGWARPIPMIKLLLPIACALMLFPAYLEISRQRLRDVFSRPLPFSLALLFNVLVSPALMFGITEFFAAGPLAGPMPELTLGLLVFGMIPAGGMGPAYTGMLGGNVNLSITVSTASLIMSMGLVPLWSRLLLGKILYVPAGLIIQYLFLIIFLPATIALIVRVYLVKKSGEPAFAALKGVLQNISVFGLILMLLIISILNASFIIGSAGHILRMFLPAASFSLFLLAAAGAAGRAFRLPYQDRIALTIGSTTKNTAIAMALAMTAFSGKGAVSIAIAGPLVQLPVMICYINMAARFSGGAARARGCARNGGQGSPHCAKRVAAHADSYKT